MREIFSLSEIFRRDPRGIYGGRQNQSRKRGGKVLEDEETLLKEKTFK